MKTVLLLVLLSVSECSSDLVGREGESVTLTCRYDRKANGARPVCWMRGQIPPSGCNNQLISTDGHKVIPEVSSRYRLSGRLDEGDVSLTIMNLTQSDAGDYGCRVDIWGWFNDKKHHFKLTINTDQEWKTETTRNTETTPGPTHSYTTGQLTSSGSAVTSSSAGMKGEQPESSSLMLVLVLVLLALVTMATAGGVILITRRWRRLNKTPQQQVNSPTSSTLQLHRRGSAVENIYQLDEGDYEYCP